MPGSGRQPINAPAGTGAGSGVPWIGLGILLVLVLILAAFVAYFFFDVGSGSGDGDGPVTPVGGGTGQDPAAAGVVGGVEISSLGYPVIATRNTTRINGSDPVQISIAAALAAYPTTGPGTPPAAVTVVNSDQWQAGVAAASLSAPPVGAPIILAPSGTLSEDGLAVIDQFDPTGSPSTGEDQIFAVGKVAPPEGFKVAEAPGGNAANMAAKLADLKAELDGGPPNAFVVVSSEQPEFATPAATWAARSGDVVLFTGAEEVPQATLDVLEDKDNADVPVFVIGPPEAVSAAALQEIDRAGGTVERVSGDDPVSNALELVRYSSGLFGWNLNDPGHGYTLARADRPMDAIAATALSTGGTWPALLLTDSVDTLPDVVSDYLLDVKPGYETDPTRALYNRIWIIGDESLIDVNQQAVVDDLAELTPVQTLNTAP
jgi:hypothetical protein